MEGIEVPFDKVQELSGEQVYAHIKRSFLRHKGALIQRAHLKSRRVFHIDNPFLSAETEATRKNRPEIWYDPLKGK